MLEARRLSCAAGACLLAVFLATPANASGSEPIVEEVGSQTVVFEEPFFGTYTVTKEARVCFDPGCLPGGGGNGDGDDDDGDDGGPNPDDPDPDGDGHVTLCHAPPGNPDNAHTITVGVAAVAAHLAHGDFLGSCEDGGNGGGGGEPPQSCDPFPDDGLFTYVYRLTNEPGSDISLIGWVVDTGIDGAVIAAGVLPGPGVEPSMIEIRNESSLVEWDFFVDEIDPGESTVELYIVSALGPDVVDTTVLGNFALDAPGGCYGPAVECGFCENGCFDCPTGPAADPDPIAEEVGSQTVEFEEPFFGSYTVVKMATVCFDQACLNPDGLAAQGLPGDGDDDPCELGGTTCDPFPDDGLFTYTYRIGNDIGSDIPLIGFVVDTLVPGAVVAAGFFPGPGVEPSMVQIRNDESLVEWNFFETTIAPGEMSVELYIVSALGPDQVDTTVLGDFALDAPGLCLGPAVECDFCDDGCFSCPTGPAQGPPCPDDGGGDPITGTLIIKQGACPAPVNPGSNGVTKMALIGDIGFDMDDVDVSTLELRRCDGDGGAVAPVSGSAHLKDLNHPNTDDVGCGMGQEPCACNPNQSSDGIDDLQLAFSTNAMAAAGLLDGAQFEVVTLELTGFLTDGTMFTARDCVRLVGNGGGGGGNGNGSPNQGRGNPNSTSN